MTTRTSKWPLVSIGIPTFNRAAELERAIRSALSQDYENVEVVISDNGSGDGTEGLCRALAATDKRIRYFRQTTNRGSTANFRFVLNEALGEFFVWLGDDDWLDPAYVSKCMNILTGDSSYSVVCGSDRYYQGQEISFDGPRLDLNEESGSKRLVSYFRQVARNGAFYGVMRRALIAEVPIHDFLGGDWLTTGAMAYFGRIKTLNDVFVHRSLGGASRDWSTLASTFSLSEFQKENPGLTIAVNVFKDIGLKSPIYAHLGPARRLALATRAFHAVFRRYYSPRHTLRLIRQLVRTFVLQA